MRTPALLATAAIALAVFAGGAASASAAGGWRAPVPGEVTRAYDLGPNPFAAGRHRGADFAARPGTAVRAPCAGRVVVAGRVGTSGRVVTLLCGDWRVSHMPLAEIAVASGALVARGDRLGTVGRSPDHDGLHLGVRREGRRFGYADPLRFLEPTAPAAPPVVRIPRARPRLTPPPARPVAPHLTRPAHPLPAAPHVTRPAHPLPASPRPGSSPATRSAGPPGDGVAPWPVWLGLGLLLAGAAGAGVRNRPRRRRAPGPRAVAQEVR